MKTNVVAQISALTSSSGIRTVREGSSVFVRVLKNNGNGSFIVSFAGKSFSIRSDLNLKVGQTFTAKVLSENGKIILQQENLQKGGKINVQNMDRFVKSSLLQNMGVPSDSVSFALLNQIKLFGAKIDGKEIVDSRKKSSKFTKDEKDAANISYISSKKGLGQEENLIQAVLGNSYEQKNNQNENKNSKTEEEQNLNCEVNPFKSFFDSVFSCKEESNSLLALFNHTGFSLGTSKINGNWIKIPFEFSYNENKNSGTGSFCAFIQSSNQFMSLASIRFLFEESEYLVNLSFKKEKEAKLEKIALGAKNSSSIFFVAQEIQNLFPNIPIELIEEDSFCDFYAPEAQFSTVEGLV